MRDARLAKSKSVESRLLQPTLTRRSILAAHHLSIAVLGSLLFSAQGANLECETNWKRAVWQTISCQMLASIRFCSCLWHELRPQLHCNLATQCRADRLGRQQNKCTLSGIWTDLSISCDSSRNTQHLGSKRSTIVSAPGTFRCHSLCPSYYLEGRSLHSCLEADRVWGLSHNVFLFQDKVRN